MSPTELAPGEQGCTGKEGVNTHDASVDLADLSSSLPRPATEVDVREFEELCIKVLSPMAGGLCPRSQQAAAAVRRESFKKLQLELLKAASHMFEAEDIFSDIVRTWTVVKLGTESLGLEVFAEAQALHRIVKALVLRRLGFDIDRMKVVLADLVEEQRMEPTRRLREDTLDSKDTHSLRSTVNPVSQPPSTSSSLQSRPTEPSVKDFAQYPFDPASLRGLGSQHCPSGSSAGAVL